MPEVQTSLEFLASSSRYQKEKPFLVRPAAGRCWQADDLKLHNVKRATKSVKHMACEENEALATALPCKTLKRQALTGSVMCPRS
jgi:hypothetical protein